MAPSKFILGSAYLLGLWVGSAHSEAQSGLNMEEFKKGAGEARLRNNAFVQVPEIFSMQKIRVSAIIYGRDRQAALILGQIVSVGDKIGTAEVMSIQRKSVTLRNENGVFRISIDRASASGAKP